MGDNSLFNDNQFFLRSSSDINDWDILTPTRNETTEMMPLQNLPSVSIPTGVKRTLEDSDSPNNKRIKLDNQDSFIPGGSKNRKMNLFVLLDLAVKQNQGAKWSRNESHLMINWDIFFQFYKNWSNAKEMSSLKRNLTNWGFNLLKKEVPEKGFHDVYCHDIFKKDVQVDIENRTFLKGAQVIGHMKRQNTKTAKKQDSPHHQPYVQDHQKVCQSPEQTLTSSPPQHLLSPTHHSMGTDIEKVNFDKLKFFFHKDDKLVYIIMQLVEKSDLDSLLTSVTTKNIMETIPIYIPKLSLLLKQNGFYNWDTKYIDALLNTNNDNTFSVKLSQVNEFFLRFGPLAKLESNIRKFITHSARYFYHGAISRDRARDLLLTHCQTNPNQKFFLVRNTACERESNLPSASLAIFALSWCQGDTVHHRRLCVRLIDRALCAAIKGENATQVYEQEYEGIGEWLQQQTELVNATAVPDYTYFFPQLSIEADTNSYELQQINKNPFVYK